MSAIAPAGKFDPLKMGIMKPSAGALRGFVNLAL
jgi:hypothetical protein